MQMSEIEMSSCRYCGSENAKIEKGTFSYWIKCPDCGLRTRQFYSLAAADKFWNGEIETDEV